jgi:menaquinone-dependent protoporphyrinogen oxidase
MNDQLEVTFDDVEMIAGALRYSKYPLPLRWLMRRIAKQAGGDTDTSRDYEYTDWEQVDGYARRLQIM